jgi:hypothetical protein
MRCTCLILVSQRPIIFVAHSLGGIILKQVSRYCFLRWGFPLSISTKALGQCHATAFNTKPHHRAIKVSTFAILYFGTPHSGANGVELAQWLTRLCSVFVYTSERLLGNLSRDSDELERIQQLYLEASGEIKPIYFYETYETPWLWIFSRAVRSRRQCNTFSNVRIDRTSQPSYHIW